MNQQFLNELDALLARHNLSRSIKNGALTIADGNAAANQLAIEGRWLGLEARDYGAVFVSHGKRFKLTGVKTSRPKYPISAECLATGRSFKFPRDTVALIHAQRGTAPAQAPAPTPPPTLPASAPHNPYANAGIF